MRARSPTTDLEHLAEICRRHSLPLTIQRRSVLQELSRRSDHPTADGVFHAVQKELQEISRTTVYRVLETFVRIGVARKVCHPGAAARYEARMQRHHHLVCVGCDSIVDLDYPPLDQLPLPNLSSGFKIEDYSIQFRGVCPECARKSSARRAHSGGSRKQTN
jgi:Fur family peroxide stress response transcriptional regulator